MGQGLGTQDWSKQKKGMETEGQNTEKLDFDEVCNFSTMDSVVGLSFNDDLLISSRTVDRLQKNDRLQNHLCGFSR